VIPPETWIPQIVQYAGFVASDTQLHRAWVKHDHSETSITNYDELHVQLFDDLDCDNLESEMVSLLDAQRGLAISRFLSAIRDADTEIVSDERYRDTRALLASDVWRDLQRVAREVVIAFAGNPWVPVERGGRGAPLTEL
jgi:hypothetical protein